jgi:hypothetical protein
LFSRASLSLKSQSGIYANAEAASFFAQCLSWAAAELKTHLLSAASDVMCAKQMLDQQSFLLLGNLTLMRAVPQWLHQNS